MKIKTNIKSGGLTTCNHNEKQTGENSKGLKVKTSIKAGFNPQPDPPARSNHNETLSKSFTVKTNVKSGGLTTCNHNEKLD